MHLWDPARTDWYPYLSRPPADGAGDASGMFRRFDVDTYRAESAGWNVEKFVNVAAATGGHSIEETIELDGNADGRRRSRRHRRRAPADRHGGRGRRAPRPADGRVHASVGSAPWGVHEGPLPDAGVLRALQERNLVFELMAHPDQLQAAADAARPTSTT